MREWMEKLEEMDPDLAIQARHDLAMAGAGAMVKRAHRNLVDTIARYSDDATGQDGEDEINAAAEDYIDSQNARIKRMDPDRYAEMMIGA